MNIYKWAKNNISDLLQKVLHITVYGAENEPLSEGVIAAANHTSFLDVIVLGIALKRQIRFLAKAELFKIPLLSALIRNLGAYSVERGKGDVAAIKKTISLLEEGELVGIFPQGHRHKGVHPRGTEIKNGIGMMAYRSGAAVLPIFIKTKNYKMKLFAKKEVYVGKPIPAAELAFEAGNSAEYKRAAEYIFDKILELEPKENS